MANSPQPNMAFTKAAFVFKDGLDKSRATKKHDQVQVAVKAVEAPMSETSTAPPSPTTNEAAHQARHQRRIRIARTVQHLLTSVLSIVIAILQGKVFVLYNQTKNQPGAWPINPNLVPTLMLFATALAALTIDICALVAYFWPKTSIGKKAFAVSLHLVWKPLSNGLLKFAHSAYAVYTTIKGISYTFSAVVCKTGMDHGSSSGNLDDLWSWTCSKKNSAQSSVTQANSNCIGSVSLYLPRNSAKSSPTDSVAVRCVVFGHGEHRH